MFVSRDNVAVTACEGDAHILQKAEGKKFFVSFKGKTIFSRSWLIPNRLNSNEGAESPLSHHIFKN